MTPSLLIIIPCYNEAHRLPLDRYRLFLEMHPEIDFCFVNDGSQDQTREILQNIQNKFSQVSVIQLEENCGKSEAVRVGMLSAIEKKNYQLLGYWDADLAHPLNAILDFLQVFEKYPQHAFVIGSRVHLLGREIPRHRLREILGKLFAVCARMALNLPIYDTQCGAKIMSNDLAKMVFQQPFLSRWLFDMEILARMNQSMGRRKTIALIYEVALREWYDPGDSKLQLQDLIQLPWDFIRMIVQYRSWKFYSLISHDTPHE